MGTPIARRIRGWRLPHPRQLASGGEAVKSKTAGRKVRVFGRGCAVGALEVAEKERLFSRFGKGTVGERLW